MNLNQIPPCLGLLANWACQGDIESGHDDRYYEGSAKYTVIQIIL